MVQGFLRTIAGIRPAAVAVVAAAAMLGGCASGDTGAGQEQVDFAGEHGWIIRQSRSLVLLGTLPAGLRRAGGLAQRERRQLQAGGPAFGALLQGFNICIH